MNDELKAIMQSLERTITFAMENGCVLYCSGKEIFRENLPTITEITFGIDKAQLEKMEEDNKKLI